MSHRQLTSDQQSSICQSRVVRFFFGSAANETNGNAKLRNEVIEGVLSRYAFCFSLEYCALLVVNIKKLYAEIFTSLLATLSIIAILAISTYDLRLLFLAAAVLFAMYLGVFTATTTVLWWYPKIEYSKSYHRQESAVGICWEEFRWEDYEGEVFGELYIKPQLKLASSYQRAYRTSIVFGIIAVLLTGLLYLTYSRHSYNLLFLWVFTTYYSITLAFCYSRCAKIAKKIAIPSWKAALVSADRAVQLLSNYECFVDN